MAEPGAPNQDTSATWTYHNRTKHSVESVRADAHMLDWANQPRPYKLYRDLDPIPLPRDLPGSRVSALSVLTGQQRGDDQAPTFDLPTLATILHHTAGITKRIRFPGGVMDFRAAACTGALYHIELYVVCRDLPGLEAGVYHFSVSDFSLRRLRAGDYRGALVEATAGESAAGQAPISIVATSTYWRNSWKYQERTYRHCFWDLGTNLANLLAIADAHRIPARVVLGFVDSDVNRLIGVDGEREVALAVVPLGIHDSTPPSSPTVEPLELTTERLSAHQVEYLPIRAMHAASSLRTKDEVVEWRAAAEAAASNAQLEPAAVADPASRPLAPRPIVREAVSESPTLEEVIRKRGSSRRFRPEQIALDQLSTLMLAAHQPIPADFLVGSGLEMGTAYVIANGVDELRSGAYAYQAASHSLKGLREGDVRLRAAHLALDQDLAGDAAMNVYFLTDLEPVLRRLGNRGYRAAQLAASITAGRLYLTSYALGLGASGLTFYDDEVTNFFSPDAAGKSVMFLIAIGRPARRQT